MLKEYLKTDKKIIKLVCGAGNEDSDSIEKLITLYSKCGCNMFDISPNIEILKTAKKILKNSEKYICVSFGMKQDKHIMKAKIDTDICIECNLCKNICPNDAIKNCNIDIKKCIGCGKCEKICSKKAIKMNERQMNFDKVLIEIIKTGVDCIEFHVSADNEEDIWEKWEKINKYYNGILSICIDRDFLGNKQVLNRIKEMLKYREPYTTIVQADGIPMSASDDRYKTTLQAVAMAEIVQNAQLPVYIILSGGTNSKTAELANICEINYKGIAYGSFARKIVKQYTDREDFYNKEIFLQALMRAKELIEPNLL